MTARPTRATLGVALVLGVGLGLPILGSAVTLRFFPDLVWDHEPVHSLLEGVGGGIALLLAGLLVNRAEARQIDSRDAWVAAGLACMGMFDLVHAAVRPGLLFVWFHSLATMAGGALIALSVVGGAPRRLPQVALTLSVLLLLTSLGLQEHLPAMVDAQGSFTGTARALNIGGGLGFYVAALLFLSEYRRGGGWEPLLFSAHFALLGSAGVLFEWSRLWDGGWWWWHLLRVAAYGVALGYVALEASEQERKVLELNDELDRRNEELEERIAAEMEKRRVLEEQRWMARLEHTQKLESMGVLAGGIAHDFNNLLVGILGNSELALQGLRPGQARDAVGRISTAARRASDLTRQMLAFSGKGSFVLEIVDLNREVREMGDLLVAGAGKSARIRWLVSQSDELLVEGDRSQLQQVVMNLITNASDALQQGQGTITLRTGVVQADQDYLAHMDIGADRPEGSYAYLEVSDTGCGMTEATRARMFDPFYTTKSKGRGLGLAATLGIVRGHNGALRVYSELGQGTTVKLLLPRAEAIGLEDPDPSMPVPRMGQGLVLVVDDEEAVRALLEAALPHFGYEALLACDGFEALRLFDEHRARIDGVILDLTMPGMSGEEVYTELRRRAPALRVIISSGFTEQDTTSRFVGKGLAGFLQKPYRLEELGRSLRLFSEE